ncbi:MAG: FKBP-type peptidyl-prolyl cis-trans isomerase [Rhodocyclales bacterium]|nr:FKBP-type peptidyl-prolyl cis-trans isomerase [Rhodocyclales bacterium]
MTATVQAGSLLTLHYRLALADDTELVSTFGSTPATLQLGTGELAPSLERWLVGLAPGSRSVFLLDPEQGFGPHNPKLMQRFVRSELPTPAELREMTLLEFKAPNGATFTGLVRELAEESALIDFNHPLAGKSIRFEVEVIGIL